MSRDDAPINTVNIPGSSFQRLLSVSEYCKARRGHLIVTCLDSPGFKPTLVNPFNSLNGRSTEHLF